MTKEGPPPNPMDLHLNPKEGPPPDDPEYLERGPDRWLPQVCRGTGTLRCPLRTKTLEEVVGEIDCAPGGRGTLLSMQVRRRNKYRSKKCKNTKVGNAIIQ